MAQSALVKKESRTQIKAVAAPKKGRHIDKGEIVRVRSLEMKTGFEVVAPMQVLRRHGPKTLCVGLPGFELQLLFDETNGTCTRGNTDSHVYTLLD